jgi:hypothetical protein
MSFDPEAVERLRSHGKAVVGGIYPAFNRRAFACEFFENTTTVRLGAQGGLLEVASLGFGFLYTRKEVYEQVARQFDLPVCNRAFNEEMLPYFLPSVESSPLGLRYLSGEQAFCARIRACGFSLYVDTTIRLSRLVAHAFGWEDAGSSTDRFENYTFHLK